MYFPWNVGRLDGDSGHQLPPEIGRLKFGEDNNFCYENLSNSIYYNFIIYLLNMFYDWCQDFYTESVRIKEQNQYLKRYTNQHRRRSKFFFRFQVRTHTRTLYSPPLFSPLLSPHVRLAGHDFRRTAQIFIDHSLSTLDPAASSGISCYAKRRDISHRNPWSLTRADATRPPGTSRIRLGDPALPHVN